MEFNNDEYPIIELNAKNQFITGNEKFKRLFLFEPNLIEKFTLKVSESSDQPSSPLKATLKFKGYTHVCMLNETKIEGRNRTYILSLVPDSRAFENEFSLKELDKLKLTNTQLRDFAFVAAHDLNEPFRTIQNFITLYKESVDHPLSEESQLYLSMVDKAAGRMRSLLEGILQYFKDSESHKENVNVNEILDEIEQDLKLQIVSSQSEIVRKNIENVYSDRNLTYLLFKNLISNAIKFRSEQKPPKIEINSSVVNGLIEYKIKDNGIGITEENKEIVFNMFKRLNPKGEYEGAGIGLSLCKKIVEDFGGEIRVESIEFQGSTFIFTLPNSDQS